METFLDGRPLLAILRGVPVDRAVELATAVWDTGVGAVEVPVQTPAALQVLTEVARVGAARGERVGAGTVITADQVSRASAAGAAFTVAPGFDPEILAASRAAGMPHLPGVATPSDVQQAVKAGCFWLKAFPASSLGPRWIRELHGPFPDVRFVATGGIDAGNAREFLDAGARTLGVGSTVTRPGGLSDLVAALTP